jgi:D-psicose/D-tagatose/L-ribulose 3-epimerase
MKFGMNLLLWTDTVTEAHWPLLDELKKMGYDGVELPIFNLDVDYHKALGKKLDEVGLRRTAVTVRTAADNPISPDASVRTAGVEANKRTLECCQAVGAETLVGPYHSALGEFSGKGPTEDEWRWGVESMQQMAEHAKKCGVLLGVEYLNRFETYFLTSAADTARFIDAVGHPSCQMMYDTFHANIEEKDLAQAIRTAGKRIVHVHISENDRSTPGAGHVDWKTSFETLKAIGYDSWMVIEAFGLALPALAAATKIWRRMFTNELQLAREGLAFMKKHAG